MIASTLPADPAGGVDAGGVEAGGLVLGVVEVDGPGDALAPVGPASPR